MLPAGKLMMEHRLIERMVTAIAKEEKRLELGGELDITFLRSAVDFMRTYADQCHHGKEENILFAKLASKPMTSDMTRSMQHLIDDHKLARGMIKRLDSLANGCDEGPDTLADVQAVLLELALLYPDHIAREDKGFFPKAMTYLDSAEREQMLREFEVFEKELLYMKYEALVKEVEA